MSNRTKGRVRELGEHRTVVRKMISPRKKHTVADPDRKWRMACSCNTVDYYATSVAAEAAAEAHLSAANGVVLHD